MMKPFAFSLCLTFALSGCSGAAPSAPTAAPAPDAATTPTSASATPKPVWSVPPPVTPGSKATPSASTAPAPASTEGITVVGTVYGDQGLPLYGAGVYLQSLDPKRPYSNRVTATKGTYTFTNVPAGAMIKVGGNLRNYEPRSTMATTPSAPGPEPFRVDLSGPYALPKLPEGL